ncbi:SoxR reducing system RseC family protein [Vibrio sp. SCSIO 43132]|uniref:SoxR reducing system RseC family protein n=1 Tax=Vibrio sp. SCSIO 43132 TaxID=2779363 RepID=UPI001CA89BDA|nr:SoxR reducing system RseC family protein [Vibrio sp. SCSIO 43132]UAB70729.1 SoxR reducing system RseC family protein [Vibrio sp. SCSIO 43132]
MMTALATVVASHPSKSGFRIQLSCEQQTSCSSCSSQKSCGTGVVSKAFGNKAHAWYLESKKALAPGQVVEIGLPEKQLLQSAALIYLSPIAFLFVGAALGHFWLQPLLGAGELAVIGMSVLFAWIGTLSAKHWIGKLEQESEEKVSLIRVLGKPLTGIGTFQDSGKP